MPFLFDLPTDLSLSIVMEWLGDTKSLLSLDSASARSSRWAYLGLVRDPAFVISKMINFGGDVDAVAIRYWISIRGVKIQTICACAAALKQVTLIAYECLATVSSVILTCDYGEQIDLEIFRTALRLLPSLTSVDLSDFPASTDEHLTVLATMSYLRLRTLILEQYEHFPLLVESFGGTLEDLDLGSSWADAEHALTNLQGSLCRSLQTLTLRWEYSSSVALTLALGPSTFPVLEKLVIVEMYPCLITNDDVVLVLCANHPNLECFVAATSKNITLSSIAVALSHCPRFREIETAQFVFKTVFPADCDPTDQPHYRLVIGKPLVVGNLRSVAESIMSAPYYKYRVREFEINAAWRLANGAVAEVIDAFGKDLFILCIQCGFEVSHQTLARLFQVCTVLRTLFLNGCVSLSDNLVMLLADHCHHIESLSLTSAGNITDLSMSYLLQRMGHGLVRLYIELCPHLSDLTMIAVSEHCVQLETLNIIKTGISADAVITYLINPNRLLKLNYVFVDVKTLQALRGFVNNSGDREYEEWHKILQCN